MGAESTGTTTMAKSLAEYYKTVWIPEFGRTYWEAKMYLPESSNWRTKEFTYIAREQNRMEDKLARIANKILICDTDSFATTLWHERYIGFISEEVYALNKYRNYDLYFLTGDEIQFVQDGTRDGEHIRHSMHKRFEDELRKRNKKYILLSGNHETRLKRAIEECDKLIR